MRTFTFGLIGAVASATTLKALVESSSLAQVKIARAAPSLYLFNDAEYLGQLETDERCNLSTATRDTIMDLFVERLVG